MNELLIQCTLCAVLAFGHYGNMPPAGAAHFPSSNQFGLYAVQGFPVWTWHSLLPLMANSQHPLAYRSWLPLLGSQPGLLLVPTMEDWTTMQAWSMMHLDQAWVISPFYPLDQTLDENDHPR